MESLQRYHNDLLYWNEKVNMISRKDVHHLWERHIIHALTLLRYISIPPKARILDLGTGGGLPGIPLKIARPDVKMTLVDSTAKKITMVKMFGEHTGLKDINAIAARVEDLSAQSKYKGTFDVIVSRAVAPITQLVDWSNSLLSTNGCFAFLKGGDLTEEIMQAQKDFPTLTITETAIDLFGMPWFKADEKKVVLCVKK